MARSFNRNQALGTSFKLEIPGLDEYNYFVQVAPLPGLSMGGVETPYRNNQTNVPSNRVEYDPLNITFLVDEEHENHSQLRLWMHKYASGKEPILEVCKDITLHILDSNKQPRKSIVFYVAYPTLLTEIQLESNTSDATSLVCNATFRYQYYDSKPTIR